jgi:hypothetical protein
MIVQNDEPYTCLSFWPLVLASCLSMKEAYPKHRRGFNRDLPPCFQSGLQKGPRSQLQEAAV